MQLAIKIAKAPMYFVGWCVLMMAMGWATVGVVWLVSEALHVLVVAQR